MTQQEDIKKAIKKRTEEDVGCMFFCGIIAYLFFMLSSSFYSIDFDTFILVILIGVLSSAFLLFSLIDILEFKYNPKKLERYDLCKRCKCLIRKNKTFCDNCKDRIKRVVKYEEDKKVINEYKRFIKQEEEKKTK